LISALPGREVTMRPVPVARFWVVIALLVAVSGCAHQPPAAIPGAPGFFHGLLHGFLLLVSLVASIFTDVRVYAFPNSGFWYDLGFVIGATSFLGGGARSARRRGG
jgi:hypothetical protein